LEALLAVLRLESLALALRELAAGGHRACRSPGRGVARVARAAAGPARRPLRVVVRVGRERPHLLPAHVAGAGVVLLLRRGEALLGLQRGLLEAAEVRVAPGLLHESLELVVGHDGTSTCRTRPVVVPALTRPPSRRGAARASRCRRASP